MCVMHNKCNEVLSRAYKPRHPHPIYRKQSSKVGSMWLFCPSFFPPGFGFSGFRFPVFLVLILTNQPQIMAYYLLTVLEQDDGVEVQRLVKDLVRSRVRNCLIDFGSFSVA